MQPRDLPYHCLPYSCSSLLPTSQLPQLWEKCENIRVNENHVKESNSKILALKSKNWVWNILIYTHRTSKKQVVSGLNSELHACSVREKKLYKNYTTSHWKRMFLPRVNDIESRGWPRMGCWLIPSYRFLFLSFPFFNTQ